jgi:hypothetical protein
MTTTNDMPAYELPAPSAAFLADAERRDSLAPLRGVLLGILLGGALWIDAVLLVKALF